ncbi:hypothetical protein J41TS12_30360 [Paenibacillus antibioticophila]|uniref:Uncharacterized protein n=1 Tax=Paenibacillus antibioticophila TaxID=1274374 RepID=A0A919XWH5_9BACL|nr:hypothetical protein J41TS12_30360 [Paenibacillus antibioticophila]
MFLTLTVVRMEAANIEETLIADLLDYYQPKRFVEVFAGGGTGADVAKSKGIRSIPWI